ncbi:MAG: hypothetical protein RL318_1287 [Fibrobacterota bacterium]|jgi:two-component system sensor histidine kinase/response regulator
MNTALKVLIVDDSPLFQRTLLKWVLGMGHDAVAVSDGLSALEAMREGRAQVVISDMMMPGISGIELCRCLRKDQERRALYFLLISADDTKERMQDALDAGVDDFLSKPVDREILANRLRIAARMSRLEAEVEWRTKLAGERERLSLALKEQERLVAVIAHELRTPLGGMRMVCDIFQLRRSELPSGLDKAADMLSSQVLGMVQTLENLLSVSNRENRGAVKWCEFDCLEVAKEAVALMEHLVPKGVDLNLRLPENLLMQGDPERIRRLVVNLLTNAARHVHAGCVIELSADRLAVDQLELCVQDTGDGISPRVLSALGEPLLLNSSNLDADRQARGSGLGLSVCKEIVARHGGSLFVESAQGIGTRVRAHLRSNLDDPSPVAAEDCLYARIFPCHLAGNEGKCQECSEDCLFRRRNV